MFAFITDLLSYPIQFIASANGISRATAPRFINLRAARHNGDAEHFWTYRAANAAFISLRPPFAFEQLRTVYGVCGLLAIYGAQPPCCPDAHRVAAHLSSTAAHCARPPCGRWTWLSRDARAPRWHARIPHCRTSFPAYSLVRAAQLCGGAAQRHCRSCLRGRDVAHHSTPYDPTLWISILSFKPYPTFAALHHARARRLTHLWLDRLVRFEHPAASVPMFRPPPSPAVLCSSHTLHLPPACCYRRLPLGSLPAARARGRGTGRLWRLLH